MTGRICGTGSCVPSFAMDNNDIAKLVDTSDEWIRERTGVVRRHIIREETTVSMAAEAGRQALENAGIAAEDVDLIIVSTISSNVILPCTACEVQKDLGAKHATCFDLSAACTGFVVAYNTAAAYLNAGVYQTALIIGSEFIESDELEGPRDVYPVRGWRRSGSAEARRYGILSSGNTLRWL